MVQYEGKPPMTSRATRRLVGVVVALGVVAAACGGDDGADDSSAESTDDVTDSDDSSSDSDDAAAVDTADAAGDATETTSAMSDAGSSEPVEPTGTVVAGYVDTVDTLNPFPQGSGSVQFRLNLFDPLIAIDAAGTPQPRLAESWEFSDDGTVLTLNLREGVTFHDGTPFDADVAVQNIELWKDPATNVQGANVWAIATPVAVDAKTVEVTFERGVPEIFALMNTAVVTKPGELDSGIGTGPFVLESYTPREGLVLTANPDYWDPSKPTVQTVDMREYADAAAAGLSAQSGDIDIFVGAQANQVAELEGAGNTIVSEPASISYDILINTSDVDDPLVRRALNMAFDRERFVDTVLQGFGTPQSSVYPPGSPLWADEEAPLIAWDLDGAKALLDEAGVDSLDVTIMSPTVLPVEQFLPIYQADLASIGVNLTIEPVDAATWGGAVSQPGAIPAMATHAYSFADLDPAMIFSAHPFRVGSNSSGYESDEYATLVAEASEIVEIDARYDAFRAIDEYIAEESFMFPVANPTTNLSFAPGVDGFVLDRAGYVFSTTTVSE